LVRVNDAGKLFALAQSPGAFAQEIFVLRNEYAAKLGRSLQQEIVTSFADPSSCAVRTSIDRRRKAVVTARGTCTSM
jgi:hypothetical protein